MVPRSVVLRGVPHVAARIPVLKHLPVFKLVAVGELAFVARRHLLHLDSDERRRLTKLLRRGRALTGPERKELRALIAKLDMRGLAGSAADQLSPLPLPRRLTRARYR